MPDWLDYDSYAEANTEEAFLEDLAKNRMATGVEYGVLITGLPVHTRQFEMKRASFEIGKCPSNFYSPLGDTDYRTFLRQLRYNMDREMAWMDDRYETWCQ